jgi:hypothetical protein
MEMFKYSLQPKSILVGENTPPFIEVDNSNYIHHIEDIKETIRVFNLEVVWDDMYSYCDALHRLMGENILYLLKENGILYGYFWIRPHPNGVYLYNLFMRGKNIDKKYRGGDFVSAVIKALYNDVCVCVDVNTWNQRAIGLFESVGFNKK